MKLQLPLAPKTLRHLLSKLKVLWRQWDIQTMVAASFTFQLVLIVFGSYRKQTKNTLIIASIWLSYLLADWVAAQAIGLILSSATMTCGPHYEYHLGQADLYTFWAQFLLLHLGGPDTITALALEDNELWLRTALHMVVQVHGTFGIVIKSVQRSRLWIPTILMFVAGIIKYLERVSSLIVGSLVQLAELPNRRNELQVPTANKRSPLKNVDMIRDAYDLFISYTGMRKKGESPSVGMDYFSERTPEEALRVIEILLNFGYDVYYTKMTLIHRTPWKILRFVVILIEVACLLMWLLIEKDGFRSYNTRITYTLLIGATVVDLFAFLRIEFSNWSIVQYKANTGIRVRLLNSKWLDSTQKRTWGRYWSKDAAPLWTRLRRVLFRRWSESISQLSLISMYVDKPSASNTIAQKVCAKFLLVKAVMKPQTTYVTNKWFSDDIRNFIFEDLKKNSKMEGAIENICHVKGGWACMSLISEEEKNVIPNVCKLLDIRQTYEFILYHCHLITELFYYDEVHISDECVEPNLFRRLMNRFCDTNVEESQPKDKYREICKILSDYMMYLLILQRELMPIVTETTKWEVFYLYDDLREACHTACHTMERTTSLDDRKEARRQKVCRSIVRTVLRTGLIDGKRLQIESEAYMILSAIKDLRGLEGKWEFMAKVWAELMYYAAIRCKILTQAAKLKQGGELLSMVGFLLLEFGFQLHEVSDLDIHLNKDETDPQRFLLYRSGNYFKEVKKNDEQVPANVVE